MEFSILYIDSQYQRGKMEWILRSPQIHSTFSNLGFLHADGYHINENCNVALETILHNILTEDKYLRTYRKSISFGQNIKKDLIPLLIHAKDDETIKLLIKILVNLTIPIECLLSVDVIAKNDFGRHTIFEINKLLTSTKTAFADQRVTKVIIDVLKKNVDIEQKVKLSSEQCTNISNGLLLLRNILHIPEEPIGQSPNCNGSTHTVQNQILWNTFSQRIDKILIKLMTIPDASNWAVTMVQLIALLYKDQHVVTLHKLLNLWLEASLSESSEDNESNTSPPDRRSEDSSPMFTSDPMSDSSDTGASGKSNVESHSNNKGWDVSSQNFMNTEKSNRPFLTHNKQPEITSDDTMKCDNGKDMSCSGGMQSEARGIQTSPVICGNTIVIRENSDCGYGTQIENQETISTSSNDDELPSKKPVHQKPHNPKQRINTKLRLGIAMQDRKRRKMVKRGKSNITNVQGLIHKTPTDNDIANILKEFTVDFLLKGYNSLVLTLYNQILNNMELEIDTSHFFWLVTYFLKFATQIELDVKHVCSVLSFDIVSYLTAEGVNLCEQFELAIKLDGNDLKPSLRRIHLIVTAIRELIQAIEMYKKFSQVHKDDQEELCKLQIKMCETEELRSLFVLLLRHYNPKYHAKQYLQDLVVTNHILLMFLDNAVKLPQYNGTINLFDHIKQFATSEMMYQYGLLLEDYRDNGEFVNDCVFTMMHHVGGELDSLVCLFQPKILKTFTLIWKSEFEICDDWSDLIEYVINTFIKKTNTVEINANICVDSVCFDEEKISIAPAAEAKPDAAAFVEDTKKICAQNNASHTAKEKWTEEELSSLSWSYLQCSTQPDIVGEIIKLFKDDSIIKSRDSIIRQLFEQNAIGQDEFEKLIKGETYRNLQIVQVNKEKRDNEIAKLCEQLAEDGKHQLFYWVQSVLLETCFTKISLEKRSTETTSEESFYFRKSEDNDVLSPVCYHSIVLNRPVPLVPWNYEQAFICKDLKFLQLLHKLGFHMPVDSGKVYIRIPNFWTTEFLYEIAGKISPIDESKLKFSMSDISGCSILKSNHSCSDILSTGITTAVTMTETTETFYQVHKRKHLATMVNYIPMPGSNFNTVKSDPDRNINNWLEVVQKSQEFKITLNSESKVTEEVKDVETDIKVPELATSKLLITPTLSAKNPAQPSPLSTTTQLMLSTIMSAKQATSTNVQVDESEFCHNSNAETASVASDLTRMYVSDEDEKPEVLKRTAKEKNTLAERDATLESDNGSAGKRPRVDFCPPF